MTYALLFVYAVIGGAVAKAFVAPMDFRKQRVRVLAVFAIVAALWPVAVALGWLNDDEDEG